jgi:hypothetical protein
VSIIPIQQEGLKRLAIHWSVGPDGDYALPRKGGFVDPEVYDPDKAAPSENLMNLTYDPTNGAESDGDIWRAKQWEGYGDLYASRYKGTTGTDFI